MASRAKRRRKLVKFAFGAMVPLTALSLGFLGYTVLNPEGAKKLIVNAFDGLPEISISDLLGDIDVNLPSLQDLILGERNPEEGVFNLTLFGNTDYRYSIKTDFLAVLSSGDLGVSTGNLNISSQTILLLPEAILRAQYPLVGQGPKFSLYNDFELLHDTNVCMPKEDKFDCAVYPAGTVFSGEEHLGQIPLVVTPRKVLQGPQLLDADGNPKFDNHVIFSFIDYAGMVTNSGSFQLYATPEEVYELMQGTELTLQQAEQQVIDQKQQALDSLLLEFFDENGAVKQDAFYEDPLTQEKFYGQQGFWEAIMDANLAPTKESVQKQVTQGYVSTTMVWETAPGSISVQLMDLEHGNVKFKNIIRDWFDTITTDPNTGQSLEFENKAIALDRVSDIPHGFVEWFNQYVGGPLLYAGPIEVNNLQQPARYPLADVPIQKEAWSSFGRSMQYFLDRLTIDLGMRVAPPVAVSGSGQIASLGTKLLYCVPQEDNIDSFTDSLNRTWIDILQNHQARGEGDTAVLYDQILAKHINIEDNTLIANRGYEDPEHGMIPGIPGLVAELRANNFNVSFSGYDNTIVRSEDQCLDMMNRATVVDTAYNFDEVIP